MPATPAMPDPLPQLGAAEALAVGALLLSAALGGAATPGELFALLLGETGRAEPCP